MEWCIASAFAVRGKWWKIRTKIMRCAMQQRLTWPLQRFCSGELNFYSYKFTEFDPNKRLKRGAKKGSAKFKSKSKFKRKK